MLSNIELKLLYKPSSRPHTSLTAEGFPLAPGGLYATGFAAATMHGWTQNTTLHSS